MAAVPSREFMVAQAVLNAGAKHGSHGAGGTAGWLRAFLELAAEYPTFGEWFGRDVAEAYRAIAARYEAQS